LNFYHHSYTSMKPREYKKSKRYTIPVVDNRVVVPNEILPESTDTVFDVLGVLTQGVVTTEGIHVANSDRDEEEVTILWDKREEKGDEVTPIVEAIRNIPQTVVPETDLVPVTEALKCVEDAIYATEKDEQDMTPVLDALMAVRKAIEDKEYPEGQDITDELDAIARKIPTVDMSEAVALLREIATRETPMVEAPPFRFNKDGRLEVEVDRIGGGGGGTNGLAEAITAHLPLNDEQRLKVSALPGMPEVCSGVLTTTVATATNVTGTGAVAGVGYIAVDVSRASNVMFSLQNTGATNMAAGQFAIEASLDSTDGLNGTWIAIQAVRSNANTIVTNTGTLTANVGLGAGFGFESSVNANMWFRLRVTTNVTTGAQAKWTILRGSYATEPIPAAQASATQAVTLTTTTVGGSATVVGFGQYRNVALSNTDVAVKTSAGRVYAIEVTNPHATDGAWLHFYNALIANVTVGTTVPVWSVYVPANTTVRQYLTIPMSMATAITVAGTTSADHTVSTAPTTALVVFVGYI
jgi:hypothetical protein